MTVLSDPAGTVMVMDDLTIADRALLAFERRSWRRDGSKERAMREQLDLTPTAYYARLGQVIDTPAALAAEPVLVKRLQRMRAARRPWQRAG